MRLLLKEGKVYLLVREDCWFKKMKKKCFYPPLFISLYWSYQKSIYSVNQMTQWLTIDQRYWEKPGENEGQHPWLQEFAGMIWSFELNLDSGCEHSSGDHSEPCSYKQTQPLNSDNSHLMGYVLGLYVPQAISDENNQVAVCMSLVNAPTEH